MKMMGRRRRGRRRRGRGRERERQQSILQQQQRPQGERREPWAWLLQASFASLEQHGLGQTCVRNTIKHWCKPMYGRI
jgi:hypothetical protein